MNRERSLSFPYTNNGNSERKFRESIPFTFTQKIIKYLGINLPKETKEWNTENYVSKERNER